MRKIILILLITCTSCLKTNKKLFKEKEVNLKNVAKLSEAKFLIGNITSFAIKNKKKLFVATNNPSRVIEYNLNGEQIKAIGSLGKGPLEYTTPSIIKVYNNKLYVWDSSQLKLIIYNDKGKPIKEYLKFQYAIKNFLPFKNYIIFYYSGGHPFLVGVYDLAKQKDIFQGGISTDEHELLSLIDIPSPITIFKNNIVYLKRSELKLNLINLDDFSNDSNFSIEDNEFKVKRISNARNIINTDFSRAIKYLNKNSYITNLFNVNNGFIVRTVNGEILQEQGKPIDVSKRYVKYYMLNKRFEVNFIAKEKFNIENKNLFSVFKGKLYKIEAESSTDKYNYWLKKVQFINHKKNQ